MNLKHNFREQLFKNAASLFSLILIVAGLTVLFAWYFNIDAVKRPLPRSVAMNPLTATCFVITGMALFIHRIAKNKKLKQLQQLLIISLFGSCFLKITGLLFKSSFQIDKVLFSQKLSEDAARGLPVNMALTTAINFLLTAAALYILQSARYPKKHLAHFFAVFIALVSLLSILGYLYYVNAFYKIIPLLLMAINTAVCFMLTALSLLFIEPDEGMMKEFTGSFSGSLSARILLSNAVIIPFVLGLTVLIIYWNGYVDTEFAIALLVSGIIVIFFALVWYTTTVLNKKDIAQRLAEKQLIISAKELASANAALQMTNKNLEEFAFVASHDLQEPLRKIITFANLLNYKYADVLPDEGKKLIAKINVASSRMSALISDLLNYSQLSSVTTSKQPVNLNTLLQEIFSDYEITIKEKNAIIEVENLKPVYGEFTQLKQVFQNLISNSLKFIRQDVQPVIKITSIHVHGTDAAVKVMPADENKMFQQLIITDNGIGFQQEFNEKVFDIFQRLHGVHEYPGTGIGLSIVKKAVTNHNGYIQANGNTGTGACFIILFPANQM